MIIEPQTERLRLRQWLPEDRAPFAALNADTRVMEYFPAPLERSESDALADRLESFISEHGWGFWAAELKGSNDFIGFVGLHIPPPAIPYSPCIEIGWRLAHGFWGHGYATEAAREALRVGFEDLGSAEIIAFTSVLNTKSRAVMERLRMVEEPETFEHPHVPVGNRVREHCAYRLSKDEWCRSEVDNRAQSSAGKAATPPDDALQDPPSRAVRQA